MVVRMVGALKGRVNNLHVAEERGITDLTSDASLDLASDCHIIRLD